MPAVEELETKEALEAVGLRLPAGRAHADVIDPLERNHVLLLRGQRVCGYGTFRAGVAAMTDVAQQPCS